MSRDLHILTLLKSAVEQSSIADVARKVDVSRTSLSLYLNDKYPADCTNLESAIRARYDRYICLHTRQEISGIDCQQRASAPKPFGGRAKVAHWEACQGCQNNHQKEKSE